MDRERLEADLRANFDGTDRGYQVVARQACDLADAGRYADDLGAALTEQAVVDELRDAPEDYAVADRWNWWLGALELSHGGYQRFRVRPDVV